MEQLVSEEMQQEIFTRLDVISQKLGVAAEHLWSIFTHQALIEGVSEICSAGLILLIVLFGFYLCKGKKLILLENPSAPPTKYLFIFIGSIVLSVFFLVYIDTFGVEAISKIFNPEYWAWKEVVSVVK